MDTWGEKKKVSTLNEKDQFKAQKYSLQKQKKHLRPTVSARRAEIEGSLVLPLYFFTFARSNFLLV